MKSISREELGEFITIIGEYLPSWNSFIFEQHDPNLVSMNLKLWCLDTIEI